MGPIWELYGTFMETLLRPKQREVGLFGRLDGPLFRVMLGQYGTEYGPMEFTVGSKCGAVVAPQCGPVDFPMGQVVGSNMARRWRPVEFELLPPLSRTLRGTIHTLGNTEWGSLTARKGKVQALPIGRTQQPAHTLHH